MSAVVGALERHARERGAEIALREGARAVSWRELLRATRAVATRFAALGAGARAIAALPNGAALASAQLAALESGIELLGVPPRTPAGVLSELIAQLGAARVYGAAGSELS
ncbi:MAG TPA: hypothetical protein VFT98_18920, partial [Myxococcota bacterium]|nr:hypothetical protein [Myxococcota bacterium]